MRVAYLILAHDKPEQLSRLVDTLPSDSPVLIHFDKRSGDLPKIRRVVTWVPRHVCRWGAPGIMHATLELIFALQGASYDYATLLSGSDYPIKPHSVIERDLAQGGEFIECFPLLEPNRWSDHGGYFHSGARMHGRYLRFRSRILRIGSRSMPDGLTPYGGSQWWSLSREALSYVARIAKDNRRLIRFLAGSFIPDELFMQAILGNSPFADRIVQDDLRLAIWDRPEPPYPATLTRSDLPLIESSPKHFARKFNLDTDPELASIIDQAVSRTPYTQIRAYG